MLWLIIALILGGVMGMIMMSMFFVSKRAFDNETELSSEVTPFNSQQ